MNPFGHTVYKNFELSVSNECDGGFDRVERHILNGHMLLSLILSFRFQPRGRNACLL